MKRKIIFPVLWLILSVFSILEAKESISVKAEVDRAFLTIGEKINLRVTVAHDPDIQILGMESTEALSDFELKETKDFRHQEEEMIHEGKNYVLTNYSLGEYVIKPITIRYRQKKGGKANTLQTHPLYLTVRRVGEEQGPDADIRPVKGVANISSRYFLWLVLSLMVIGAGIFLWSRLQTEKKLSERPMETVLSPQDEAYRAIGELAHSELLRRGEIKLYFLRLSEIMRRFLERRFAVHTLEETTREVIQSLKPKLAAGELESIGQFLSACDLVKFAKYLPPALEIQERTNEARRIVDRNKEQVQEVVSADSKAAVS